MLISPLVGVVLVPLAIPWGYVVKQHVKAPGIGWATQATLFEGKRRVANEVANQEP